MLRKEADGRARGWMVVERHVGHESEGRLDRERQRTEGGRAELDGWRGTGDGVQLCSRPGRPGKNTVAGGRAGVRDGWMDGWMHLDEARGRRRQGAGQSEQSGFGVAAARSCREAGPGPGWRALRARDPESSQSKTWAHCAVLDGRRVSRGHEAEMRTMKGEAEAWMGAGCRHRGGGGAGAVSARRRGGGKIDCLDRGTLAVCIRLTADTRPDSRGARFVARRASSGLASRDQGAGSEAQSGIKPNSWHNGSVPVLAFTGPVLLLDHAQSSRHRSERCPSRLGRGPRLCLQASTGTIAGTERESGCDNETHFIVACSPS